MRLRAVFQKESLSEDAVAGLVLGVESVPDGLAAALLAGVNPVAGLYAYMYGTFFGALVTSTSFMAVQATGAMAIIVADVDALHSGPDQGRALFTLSILTGLVMVAAGLLRLGSVLRFVSSSVMAGFIAAVGVSIVLGQLGNFTGFEASGSNRISKTLDLLVHVTSVDVPTVAVGTATIGMILVLERTRLGALGMVVAIVIGSALAAGFTALDRDVALIRDLATVPRALPAFTLPLLREIPALLVPAISLAFVGLVQGAAVSAGFPNPDGTRADASRDFIGQGAANVAAGLFRGMPVGGSMSASSLVVAAGAKTRRALLIAGVVMAAIVLVLAGAVGYIAMPALAGLLIVVGMRTVKPTEMVSVAKTGTVQATVVVVTAVLTMLIPLQYAVLVGVGISLILYVVRQSNQLTTRRLVVDESGRVREVDPPAEVGPSEVVVLQPYGSLFFAAAPVFEQQLPTITEGSRSSVVILRLRGRSDVGATFIDVLARYATSLSAVGSKLVLVSDSDRVHDQLLATGVAETIGGDNIYRSDEWLGRTVERAYRDAVAWVTQRTPGPPDQPEASP
ncbi:MAG TPA: SulP family inorganic anion transporter [Acidimicrobiia bacterium]|nr:SulP family inorganic anion transporter [Acidimicrobiia bacterium]